MNGLQGQTHVSARYGWLSVISTVALPGGFGLGDILIGGDRGGGIGLGMAAVVFGCIFEGFLGFDLLDSGQMFRVGA